MPRIRTPDREHRMTRTTLAILALLAAGPAFAQTGRHAGHTAPAAAGSEAAREFRATSERMHGAMAIRPSGDPDRDFAAAMIPHHQGAIDMARVVLRHGRDPEIRRIAEEVVRAQEGEIATLRPWLARNPG
jgi:uncharacterized protein (DUF305 family)